MRSAEENNRERLELNSHRPSYCPCCKDVHNAHQLILILDLDISMMLQVVRGTAAPSLTPGQFKQAGMLSTSGSVSVPPHSKSSVLSAAVQGVMG